MSKIEKHQLNDSQLDKVTGGDFGDSDKEYADTPEGVVFLYNIGDHVEVYTTGFHVTTTGGTIIDRRVGSTTSGCETKYQGEYLVRFDNGKESWHIADYIER